jgi:ribokinase
MSELLILGNLNLDLVLGPLAEWPAEGTETLVASSSWRVGGNAGNAALTGAALGVPLRLLSTVGDDLPGQWLQAQLPGGQTDLRPVARPTSVTVALTHPGGERSFITHLGHLETLAWADLASGVGRPAAALLAGGFLTPALRRSYPAVLRQLVKGGAAVALDPGWPPGGFTPAVRQEVLGWLPWVQHLLINAAEASGLTGEVDPQRAAGQLADQLAPGGTAVIKCGARGVTACRGHAVQTVPAPVVTVRDTVGAGDSFNAAYLGALLAGEPLADGQAAGVGVASAVVAGRLPGAGLPEAGRPGAGASGVARPGNWAPGDRP